MPGGVRVTRVGRLKRFRLGAAQGPTWRGELHCNYVFPLDLQVEAPYEDEQHQIQVSFTSGQILDRDDALVPVLARWLAQSRLKERFVRGCDLPEVVEADDDEVRHFFTEVDATGVSMDPDRWLEVPLRRKPIGF